MAIVCLTSASGSPGVTTTAVGMAFSWPRPVLLVEADPTGGSGVLAGFLRGTTAYDAGLIEFALSPLGTADALRDVVRPLSPNVSLVAGIRSHAQATALRDLWEPLAAALRDLDDNGQDVIVDVGRLGLMGSPTPLLDAANAVGRTPVADDVGRMVLTSFRSGAFIADRVDLFITDTAVAVRQVAAVDMIRIVLSRLLHIWEPPFCTRLPARRRSKRPLADRVSPDPPRPPVARAACAGKG